MHVWTGAGQRDSGRAARLVLVALAVPLLAAAPATATAATAVRRRPPRPPLNQLIGHYLDGRPGAITVAIEDVNTGERWDYNGAMRNDTASIVKVDILETRLSQSGGHLSAGDAPVATEMIEDSDNDAATELWNEDGGSIGVGAYNARAGLRCTSLDPFGAWGLTLTCARDQIRLLQLLARPNRILSRAAQGTVLALMEHVVPWQAWGVTGGLPGSGVTVALKNGWLPYGSAPWIVNSIGIVRGDGRDYYIAALTRDPSEQDGIDTIEGVSGIVWRHITRHPWPPRR